MQYKCAILSKNCTLWCHGPAPQQTTSTQSRGEDTWWTWAGKKRAHGRQRANRWWTHTRPVDKRRQVGNKCEIMRAEHPEPSGRQMGDKGRQLGDTYKIMGAEHPQSSGREVGDKGRQVGYKCKILRARHPESSGRQMGDKGRQVGDKCKIMRAELPEASGRWVGGKRWQVENKCRIMRAEHAREAKWETHLKSWGQYIHNLLGDKWETNVKPWRQSIWSLAGHKWETSTHKWEANVKPCGHSIQSVLRAGKIKPGDKCKIMRPEDAPSSKEQELLTGKPVCRII